MAGVRSRRQPLGAALLAASAAGIVAGTAAAQVQVKKLVASDAAALDFFGGSVAVSGDLALAGAPNDDDDGSGSGSAYVFSRNLGGTGNWGQVIKLTASDAAAGDQFGISVALDGDVAVVGAVNDDDAGTSSGSAYVFSRNQGGPDNWGEVKKLTASDAAASDMFGERVSVSGDVVIVGAAEDDDDGLSSGSAYVFFRNQGGPDNWGEIAKLTASDAAAGDRFGGSVAASGDVAVVGAREDDDDGTSSGAVYLFYRNQGGPDNWGEVVKQTASDAASGDALGWYVAVSGDIAVAGAIGDDDNGNGAGAAYVFMRNEGGADNWGEVAKLLASDGAGGDEFGGSVALSGDVALVGANLHNGGHPDNGAAYLFIRNEGGVNAWGQVANLTAADDSPNDRFGFSVAISGDIAVSGSGFEDSVGTDAGSAYVFDLTDLPPCPWDANNDGQVDVIDLLGVLGHWGACP